MLQVFSVGGAGGGGPRDYVIEKAPNVEGGTSYVVYWCDHAGMTPFSQRMVLVNETAIGAMQMMTRHYPGATCKYIPEDVVGIIADAIRATEGTE